MGDLTTPFNKPILPSHDVSGDSVVGRGSDPNAAGGAGPAGLQDFWPDDKQAMTADPGIAESANSVSGLPPLPNRFEPSGTPPEPPSLQDRVPGTIDQK